MSGDVLPPLQTGTCEVCDWRGTPDVSRSLAEAEAVWHVYLCHNAIYQRICGPVMHRPSVPRPPTLRN